MAPFVTILRLLLVVSGLAALGYAPSLARTAQGETVTLTEARVTPDAPVLRAPLPEQPKGDLPGLALSATTLLPEPPQRLTLAVLLPEATPQIGRPLLARHARAPPLA